jgi:hypothetical protein
MKGELYMDINFRKFSHHNLTGEEYRALVLAGEVMVQLIRAYYDGTILQSLNDREIVVANELKRTAGILSFLTRNPLVNVERKS